MSTSENQIVDHLLPQSKRRLLALCQPFELHPAQVLDDTSASVRQVHFLRSGFVSLVIDLSGYPALQVGMVGREGQFGAEALLGSARPPWRAVALGAGQGLRIDLPSLHRLCVACPDLQRLLLGSLLVRVQQQAIALACERFHPVGARLVRWLLMSQDRAAGPQFHVTQAAIARLLGVRRVSVTVAASDLQRQGLIDYHRGEVRVLDRTRLKALACSCYAADLSLARGLFGARPKPGQGAGT